MTLATLNDILPAANAAGRAVAGLTVLGWEDAEAWVEAAEAEGAPLILMAGPGCRRATPVAVIGAMFRALAERASVPVVAHLDHGASAEDCAAGIDAGFSSVMYDGSKRPLGENIAEMRRVVALARAAGVSTEGEVGEVGYAPGSARAAPSAATDPEQAGRFAEETEVDALAISIGNIHLVEDASSRIDFAALAAIEARTSRPLVIHGSSGISHADRLRIAGGSRVAKFNIGTELRMATGAALRAALLEDAALYDRIEIFRRARPAMVAAARTALRSLMPRA